MQPLRGCHVPDEKTPCSNASRCNMGLFMWNPSGVMSLWTQRQDAAHRAGCRTSDGCGVYLAGCGDNPGGVALCITPCCGRRHDARYMGPPGLPVARTPEGFHLGGAVQVQPLRGCHVPDEKTPCSNASRCNMGLFMWNPSGVMSLWTQRQDAAHPVECR